MLSSEREALEEEIVDAATAARTAEELRHEIGVLEDLVRIARRVRHSGTDVKWQQLSNCSPTPPRCSAGIQRHKIIIFTEHRDTLGYLTGSDPRPARQARGGRLHPRRGVPRGAAEVQDAFRQDPNVTVLVATDAAGEGLNLQRAHLMINYDLPWNPNRIEQRFGRIHRIGQTEPCHLWNLVAEDTREGDVYLRLLDKLDQMRRTYQGKVFDVIGEVFEERSLADLLMEAIRYGDLPETKAKLRPVIDDRVARWHP